MNMANTVSSMAGVDDKENVAPCVSSDNLHRRASSPAKKPGKKGRSKSIGPGDVEHWESVKQDAKNRRKSAFVPASRSIISTEAEKAERQAARRRTLANRRVSFAPEATLHTWDVIELMRDHTTSTDASDQTRRSGNGGTPYKQSNPLSSDDEEPPSTPPEQEQAPEKVPASPAPQRDLHKKQRRRSSGVSPTSMDQQEDEFSLSGASVSSDASGSEDEGEEEDLEDATGTAMSLDTGEETVQSSEGDSSTSSSLTHRLQEAAHLAGTRGIEYDEHGEGTMSMEIAGEEITNAFKPWAQRATAQSVISASLDQENVNPFSPAFKAQIASGLVTRPATIEEENTGDLSMDVTRAVGTILKAPPSLPQPVSSPAGDGTMDFTQAIPKIITTSQKRRRSTTEAGSPSTEAAPARPKRSKRSSVARSSMGDDTMDLTMAIGGIQDSASPAPRERRRSARRRSSGVAMELDNATMEFTQVVGGINAAVARVEHTTSGIDENEELTMELTTVLGGIRAAERAAAEARPATPPQQLSPVRQAANTTPKDQERFVNVPDSGPKKLLTPLFQKQVKLSAEKSASANKRRQSITPAKISWTGAVFDETQEPQQDANTLFAPVRQSASSPLKNEVTYPEVPPEEAVKLTLVSRSPLVETPPSVRVAQQQLLDEQLRQSLSSPTVEKVLRSSPLRAALTPERSNSASRGAQSHEARNVLIDSIRLMSTPRKESLKTSTPKKSAASPARHTTPRPRPTPKSTTVVQSSRGEQLSSEILRAESSEPQVEKIQLQDFLEEAGIRFMDLTATKRRLTTVPTPSKVRRTADSDETQGQVERTIDLEQAIVAAACQQPEHDMFQHACHELKHYISEGKKVIKQLEADTYLDTPPLIRAYITSSPERKAALDAQMRDMKTQARFRSREMWYAWRSQLLEDLMKGLSGIGEGLLRDDEVVQRAEELLEETLPGLLEQQARLQEEAERLELAAVETSVEEKEELGAARSRVVEVEGEMEEKGRLLEELRREAEEQEALAADLRDSKTEFAAAIQEADRVRDACRGVSLKELVTLKGGSYFGMESGGIANEHLTESISHLETTHGWAITSASSQPPTVTMTYKSQLQLFFHPAAFLHPSLDQSGAKSQQRPNAPISLVYIAQPCHQQRHPQHQSKDLPTTLRFFLQFLRASLHALPQSSTRVAEVLGLVSSGWDAALAVSEAERRLDLGGLTTARILSDERLAIETWMLYPGVRTKVRAAFEVSAGVGEGLRVRVSTGVEVGVVYGEAWDEGKMAQVVSEGMSGGGGGGGGGGRPATEGEVGNEGFEEMIRE
ncbi:hypothetical protein LTR35_007270 [Friedmanniomyces endolithicus]|uniref:Spc7 kinetochore protein domain-containing protein n=1 Tax=Friedmanniomyces endolithicus TaxID=329885 RepID=A0AAN6F9N1_9PEZI|nr:hypothetical protein LTS00_014982 [Friedmanniomyces endolithicus]KAK0281591.1 hypothetical protein LTR35_007270 [Friedmanniomyces endolithicus]KAK0308664.1 hypothetical protein LTR82_015476 [Friedmanniomyces endolithicus]KAK1008229.1 hypothetical protein LTR54_006020 [Friedmanniomyces endolithicus]